MPLEAWLATLSPAQLRAVLADSLTESWYDELTPAYRVQAFALAPEAASLATAAEAESQAAGDAPALVRTPDGSVYYTAGGPRYRKVPNEATLHTLELDGKPIVTVDELALATDQPWPSSLAAEAAASETGRKVAGSGDVGAAWRFARFTYVRLA